ncbi:MAG: dihydrolipoyllysine-residue acetyltransferase [Porticoccaceae bacterium]
MAVETIKVPDLGGAEAVEVIEISVAPGDEIRPEDTLLVLESDKATMDVPSPVAGVVKKILVKLGDSVSSGSAIVDVEVEGDDAKPEIAESEPENEVAEAPQPAADAKQAPPADKAAAKKPAEDRPQGGTSEQTVKLPDLGTTDEVDVIELAVAAGDEIAEGQALMTLEGDKAAMDVPSPYAGKLVKLLVESGAKVKSGDAVAVIEVTAAAPAQKNASDEGTSQAPQKKAAEDKAPEQKAGQAAQQEQSDSAARDVAGVMLGEPEAPAANVYAGPVVRQFARELGVDLRNVEGSGTKGRIQKEDVQAYVKAALETHEKEREPGSVGAGIPAVPDVDFSQFGEVEEIPLDKIARLTAANMVRNWLNVPMVTQFDDADITEMEAFRASLKAESEKRGVKLTPVAFIMLACARLLRDHPVLNRSWHSSGEKVIQKKYIHIGMAVDTPRGLLVPVVRDADKKGLFELAADIAALAEKARTGKLTGADMQGGSFTISSLGAIGGRGFTPIVNAPEVAILGVSRAATRPVWTGSGFEPRQVLPLSLSYDHRVVNGGDGGRFFTALVEYLSDIRRFLL